MKVSLPSFRIWRNRNNHLRINLNKNNPNFWPWRKPNNPCSLKWRRRKLSGKWRNKLLWINTKSKNKFCRGSSERIRSWFEKMISLRSRRNARKLVWVGLLVIVWTRLPWRKAFWRRTVIILAKLAAITRSFSKSDNFDFN